MKHCPHCGKLFCQKSWHCSQCGYAPQQKDGYLVFAPDLSQCNDAYTVDFFANLAELEKGHFWFEARNRILVWAARKYFPQAQKLLEIGCGTGFVLHSFQKDWPEIDLWGSALLVKGLSFAAERVPTSTLFQMDARNIPYEREFDVIGAFDVIEHIEQDDLVLSQIYKAIKPGGGS